MKDQTKEQSDLSEVVVSLINNGNVKHDVYDFEGKHDEDEDNENLNDEEQPLKTEDVDLEVSVKVDKS